MFVTNDLSYEERKVQRQLREKRDQLKAEHKDVRLAGRSLVIDGIKIGYEDLDLSGEDNDSVPDGEDSEGSVVEAARQSSIESGALDDVGESSQAAETEDITTKPGPQQKRKSLNTPTPPARSTRANKKKRRK